MNDRGTRRGPGAPFYAPPRRKTSAEIISEARAAVYGEMNGSESGSGGALRPLRTRRPFTPREPQRTLFTERARKTDPRPPSAFDLKYLSLSESAEEMTAAVIGARVPSQNEEKLNGIILTETHNNAKKNKSFRNSQQKLILDRSGDGWSGFPKLPHLSGRSKPLHRRNTTGHVTSEESNIETNLAQAISVTRPLGSTDGDFTLNVNENNFSKSLSPETKVKRKHFATNKSVTYDFDYKDDVVGDIGVKHLSVPLPNASGKLNSTLDIAEALSERNQPTDRIVLLLEALQDIVDKSSPANSLRELVLKSLYTHIDCEDERVLVGIARAMLTLRVIGPHLAAACKLVFKIARNDKNDKYFKNTNLLELLVEGCGRADPLTEGECCVYGAGALRFLALEPRLCALAHKAGALHLAALHLKILNSAKAENSRAVSDQSTHALYQLTGALRNLAGAEKEAKAFVASGALAELVAALNHHTDRDVLTNVARCLSVLSAEDSCCAWLCASSVSAQSLLRALAACAARAPLAVRLAYTLGNMAAADEQARINIYNEDGGVDVLLTIIELYTKRNDDSPRNIESDPDLHLIGTDLGGSDGSNEDVLIKTVRVVANLCLCERAGRGLAHVHAERAVRCLLGCLELESQCTEQQSPEDHPSFTECREELATAALATLNNITFYRSPPDPPDPLHNLLDQLCKATCRRLLGIGPAACEAVRALGNLSRGTSSAQLIVLEGALDLLVPFLEHDEASVRCAAAGVLVNVCGAGTQCNTAAALAARSLLAAADAGDAPTAALLARALWNAHAHAPLSPQCAHQAAAALATFIDDESVFDACEASRIGDRRASDPALFKHHVHFDIHNNNDYTENENAELKPFIKANSLDQELNLDHSDEEADRTGHSGEDLGFEEGEGEEECECGPCRRLAAWEELVGVAIPLLEKLRPPRADASVGTE